MAENALIEQLNNAIDAIVAGRDEKLAAVDPAVAVLVGVAADLGGLPSRSFKIRLKAELVSAAATQTYTDIAAETDSEQRSRTMTTKPKPVPDAYPSVTPYLCCKNAAGAIEFYKQAFGAREFLRLTYPDGRIGHAEVMIGNTPVMLADEHPEYGNLSPESLGGSPVTIHLYVEDVDAVASRAVAAGAKLLFPVADQFYGDRSGRIADPFGHVWIVSTHKEDVSAEEMQQRFDAMMAAESSKPVKPVPEGFHTITPYLHVEGAAKLIDFMKEAFAVQEVLTVPRPDGTLIHAEVRIGDSMIEMGDAPSQPAAIHLYVEDADAVYERALRAGAASLNGPTDQPYGDREAAVRDPFGNNWYIATHKLTGKPIPEGLRSITPYLHPRGAGKLIDFLRQAFNAEVAGRHESPDGTIVHAKMKIGDSIVEMSEAHGEWGPMPCAIHLYVSDADAVYKSAMEAGAASLFEPRDEAYGDRIGAVTDPSGNMWYIATHIKDVTM